MADRRGLLLRMPPSVADGKPVCAMLHPGSAAAVSVGSTAAALPPPAAAEAAEGAMEPEVVGFQANQVAWQGGSAARLCFAL
mmetsp:Transcript_533/g.896  ORF Transcript_533/g.896 Transcript_533/m.896 type:complete len:82 (-) Transcript_533:453-698(-)